MKNNLMKLAELCDIHGEKKVMNMMENTYCNGSQGSELVSDTVKAFIKGQI